MVATRSSGLRKRIVRFDYEAQTTREVAETFNVSLSLMLGMEEEDLHQTKREDRGQEVRVSRMRGQNGKTWTYRVGLQPRVFTRARRDPPRVGERNLVARERRVPLANSYICARKIASRNLA